MTSAESTGRRWPRMVRWRNRGGAFVAVAALASTLAIAATPAAARADAICSESGVTCVPCPSAQTMAMDGEGWYNTGYGVWMPGIQGKGLTTPATTVMEITSYTPVFVVEQQKVAQNYSTTLPNTVTFTSSVAQTITLTESVAIASGTSSTLQGFASTLTETIGVQIAIAWQTSVGVNDAVTIPPQTQIVGQYGIPAYNVSYDQLALVAVPSGTATNGSTSLPAGSDCILNGSVTGTAIAPQPEDGWRIGNPTPL